MEGLEIKNEEPKAWAIYAIVFGTLMLILNAYLCLNSYLIDNGTSFAFYLYLINTLLAVVFVLKYTVFKSNKVLLFIDNNTMKFSLPSQRSQDIEWVNISRVAIGAAYLIFHTNGGQKQEKVSLSSLKYEDVMTTKAKVIELCEFKNIPYNND